MRKIFILLFSISIFLITIVCVYIFTPQNIVYETQPPFEFVKGQLSFNLPKGWHYDQKKSEVATLDKNSNLINSIYYYSNFLDGTETIATLETSYQSYEAMAYNFPFAKRTLDTQFPNSDNRYDVANEIHTAFGTITNINTDSTLSNQNFYGKWYTSQLLPTNHSKFLMELLFDNAFVTFQIEGTSSKYYFSPKDIDELIASLKFSPSYFK
jgi:hypothetical protein